MIIQFSKGNIKPMFDYKHIKIYIDKDTTKYSDFYYNIYSKTFLSNGINHRLVLYSLKKKEDTKKETKKEESEKKEESNNDNYYVELFTPLSSVLKFEYKKESILCAIEKFKEIWVSYTHTEYGFRFKKEKKELLLFNKIIMHINKKYNFEIEFEEESQVSKNIEGIQGRDDLETIAKLTEIYYIPGNEKKIKINKLLHDVLTFFNIDIMNEIKKSINVSGTNKINIIINPDHKNIKSKIGDELNNIINSVNVEYNALFEEFVKCTKIHKYKFQLLITEEINPDNKLTINGIDKIIKDICNKIDIYNNKLKLMNEQSLYYEYLLDYCLEYKQLNNSPHSRKYNIINLYEVLHQDDFTYPGPRYLLFHGTKNCNIENILKNGLILDNKSTKTGSLFGKGIYFSSSFIKSMNYCDNSASSKYMFICEVSLGETLELTATYNTSDYYNYDEKKMKELQKDSISAMGKYDIKHKINVFGSIFPKGIVELLHKNNHLNYNEFIVYNSSRCRIKYLVKFTT